MLKKKMLIPALALGLALTFALSDEASAQWGYGWGHSQSQFGHVNRHVPSSSWGYGQRSYYPNYGCRRTPVYHDTTHLDYHPPQVIRHGRHFHIQPGHYDVHRTGHWHH